MEKSKLAPAHAITIPRLKLCSAVLAVELADLIQYEHVAKPVLVVCYSDSKVVLGYIANQTRRFYVYVTNRLQLDSAQLVFAWFSKWSSLVKGLSRILATIRAWKARHAIPLRSQSSSETTEVEDIRAQTVRVIIANVQEEAFEDTAGGIKRRRPLPASSPLLKLKPLLVSDGLLRVGDRL